VVQKSLSGQRQLNTVRATMHQLNADFLLEIPYLPAAAAKKKENQANWAKLDPEVKCYLPGLPRATYLPYPFQIVQSQKNILISYEFAGAVRVHRGAVRLRGRGYLRDARAQP